MGESVWPGSCFHTPDTVSGFLSLSSFMAISLYLLSYFLFSIPPLLFPLAITSKVFPYSIIFWYCLWTLFIATLLIPKAVPFSLDLKFLFVRLFSPGEQQQQKFHSEKDPSFLSRTMPSTGYALNSLSNKGTTGQTVYVSYSLISSLASWSFKHHYVLKCSMPRVSAWTMVIAKFWFAKVRSMYLYE